MSERRDTINHPERLGGLALVSVSDIQDVGALLLV
jgi:hypothetical protein